jgi:hypothetical protein
MKVRCRQRKDESFHRTYACTGVNAVIALEEASRQPVLWSLKGELMRYVLPSSSVNVSVQ